MTDKARLAVIGTGWWSTYTHIPALQAHPGAALVALCDCDPARLRHRQMQSATGLLFKNVGGWLPTKQNCLCDLITKPRVCRLCERHDHYLKLRHRT